MAENREFDLRTLTNPLDTDFVFSWDRVEYVVPANSTKSFPAFLAEHGSKHLANKLFIVGGRMEDVMKGDKLLPMPVDWADLNKTALSLLDQEKKVLAPVVEKKLPTPEEEAAKLAEAQKAKEVLEKTLNPDVADPTPVGGEPAKKLTAKQQAAQAVADLDAMEAAEKQAKESEGGTTPAGTAE